MNPFTKIIKFLKQLRNKEYFSFVISKEEEKEEIIYKIKIKNKLERNLVIGELLYFIYDDIKWFYNDGDYDLTDQEIFDNFVEILLEGSMKLKHKLFPEMTPDEDETFDYFT